MSGAKRKGPYQPLEGPSPKKITMYDPPAGWRYGFPKQYLPKPGESLADTLRRDGYPEKEIKNGGDRHVRFWEA